ncbi:MAG TPA: hypothetical protein VHA77_13450 [Xanthobacteraceae bacterium]|jgi:uncharacterized membrane protein YphA (DoxX/SURF4 family)|nr:hypothetical protein [Xanthobacteraceae bacterium]
MPALQNPGSLLANAGLLLMVAFFLITAALNVRPAGVEDHVNRLKIFRAPFPRLTFWIGIAMEVVGCALVLTGWHADIGVMLLIAFTILATALLLRFWDVQDPMKRTGMRLGFLANIGVLGGLLLLLSSVR